MPRTKYNNLAIVRPEQTRIFCAVKIPPQALTHVMAHIASLRALVPDVRASWSRENSIHLTLKFFGEIPEALINNFGTAISRAVSGVVPFPILIADSGVFPQRRDPRVLWIGVTDLKGQLTNLHERLETAFEKEGFPRDTRPFHPHLTLARLRNQRGARDIARIHEELSFPPDEITVTELLLIRSELSSKGSKYTTISQHPLRN